MNIFKRILTGIAEDVVGVTNENHVLDFFKVTFFDKEIIYFCGYSADEILNCLVCRRLRCVKFQTAV